MIWPMANSQMLTSKTPRSGARAFMPRATKIVRMVASVTTHSSATKTSRGSQGDIGMVASAISVTGPPPHQSGHPGGQGAVPGTGDGTCLKGGTYTTGRKSSQAEFGTAGHL